MKKKTKAHDTGMVATVAATTTHIIAPVWLVPAILVNIDWTPTSSIAWNVAAVVSIAASAVFVEAARRAKPWSTSAVFGACAAVLIFTNLQIAFDNASHRSADRSDLRQAQLSAFDRASSQRKLWSQERDEAIKIAGMLPTATVESEIDRILSKGATRWRSTVSCTPEAITARASASFCSELATLRGKLAAAKKRNELTASMRRLDAELSSHTAPTSPDAFMEGASALMSALGMIEPDAAKSWLRPLTDLLRALALELIAAIGPSAWFIIFSQRFQPPQVARRHKVGHTKRQRLLQDRVALESEHPSGTDSFNRFVSAQIEKADGAILRAGAAWMAYQAWCAKERIDPGSQKRFGSQMKRLFEHDRNNNRPRYLGVMLRARFSHVTTISKPAECR